MSGPEDQYLSLAEQLTLNFYLWERRGRGWQVWDWPVELEPPFQPFYHQQVYQPPPVDDARKPTFLSSLTEGLFKGSTSYSQTQEIIPREEDPYPLLPVPFADPSPLTHVTISLSPQSKVTLDQAEHFLLNLRYCSQPVAFELFGTHEAISLGFTSRNTDFHQVRQQLQAYFPEAVLSQEHDLLRSKWDDEKQTVIIDFGLSNEFMRPLRTFRNVDPDPLIGMAGALEDLEEEEVGMLQVLFQTARNPWQESILRSVTDLEGRPFFLDAPDMIHLAKEKVQTPFFGVVIRVVGQSQKSHRAWEIAKALGSCLSQLANSQSNELIPLTNDEYDDVLHQEDVLSRQSRRFGMLLNNEELVSLVHLPSVSVQSKKLLRQAKKTKAAPKIALGHELTMGENLHQGKTVTVGLGTEQRLRHTYVVGATGTGKSTLLLNLVIQDITNGQGVGVLDPHGDLIDKILGFIPEERYKDVVLLDPADAEYPIGLNILSSHSEIEKNVLSSDLVAVFRRLSTSWGDQMTSVLGNAILAFLESEQGGTLVDLRRFLVEPDFRNAFLSTVKDPEVVYYWKKEFPLLAGKPQASVLTRLDTFLRPKLIRNLVMQKKGLNFEEILNTKKIFLAKLAQGLIGEENAYLLGTLIVSKLHQIVMSRQAKTETERENFYLYIDEFQNFITPSMAAILSGARKYHLGLILAHQELRQLWNRDTEVANSVISNPYTRICFRLGDFDAKKLAEGFSSFGAEDLQNLGIGEALVRVERAEFDFNLSVPLPSEITPEALKEKQEKLIALSRSRYSRPKKEIETTPTQKQTTPMPSLIEPKKSEPHEKALKEAESKRVRRQEAEPVLDEKLPADAELLLEFISQHPGMFVTQVYKELRLSGYKGDRLKEQLIKRDLLVQEETREGKGGRLAKVLTLTGQGQEILKKSSLLKGKGGDLHTHLQTMLKEQAELYGWKARIEERISRSLESVDVGLKRDDVRVAIEISSTSKAGQEVQNIRKCLDAGYDYVICVCADEKRIPLLKKESRKNFTLREWERLRFLLPSQVKEFLYRPPILGMDSEKRVVSEEISQQKQLLDTTKASQFLGISKNTLYEWIVQKKVPHVKVGRLVKFRREDLEEWLKQRTKEEEKKDFL
ncbi:MAG: helix-turn-helix domain-containing protein [Thermodesulfobacteriota bacterium]|nr:MAG: helix-turn-helix domain-containing protein [Thermodesulfobacteriota bacterium]